MSPVVHEVEADIAFLAASVFFHHGAPKDLPLPEAHTAPVAVMRPRTLVRAQMEIWCRSLQDTALG